MASATQEQINARLSRLNPQQLANYYASVTPSNAPGSWAHPDYQGSDSAYQAWLAQADLQGQDALSSARLRRAQTEQSYQQALTDLMRQGETGRRTIQSNMLQRGIFRSGETDRRKLEYDALIEQGKARAAQAEQDQFGQIDETQRNALSNLGMQAATQVSQAMMRDALNEYNQQQQASQRVASPSTPPPQAAYTPPSTPAPNYNPNVPAQPNYKPVTSTASLSNASSAKPKPNVAPKLKRTGLQ